MTQPRIGRKFVGCAPRKKQGSEGDFEKEQLDRDNEMELSSLHIRIRDNLVPSTVKHYSHAGRQTRSEKTASLTGRTGCKPRACPNLCGRAIRQTRSSVLRLVRRSEAFQE